jgi:hypothetical protein
MTASQTESSSAPEAIEDQPDSGGPSRTVSLFGGNRARLSLLSVWIDSTRLSI